MAGALTRRRRGGSRRHRRGSDAATDSRAGASTSTGTILLPGFIDVHTDNLESIIVARLGVFWNGRGQRWRMTP